jgi:hypothetical protein
MRSEWWWRGLHLALALTLPLALALLVGCKKAKEEKADLGPEVAPELIDEALSKAVYGASLDGLRVGEYIDYAIERRLENEESTITLGGTNVSVIDAEENNTKYTLRITRSFRRNDGSFQVVTGEDVIRVNPSAPASLSLPPESAALNPSALSAARLTNEALARASADGENPRRVTFHRLRESDGVEPAPAKVRLKPDCGGLSPCEIPVHYIQFDMVTWSSDDDYQKMSLDFAFSRKTPFLPFGEDFDQLSGLLVIDCRSLYVDIGTRDVYVRDCQQLDDFQK